MLSGRHAGVPLVGFFRVKGKGLALRWWWWWEGLCLGGSRWWKSGWAGRWRGEQGEGKAYGRHCEGAAQTTVRFYSRWVFYVGIVSVKDIG